MATWNTRGLRGSTLEELINQTISQYDQQGLALIQKIPTPITPVQIDKESRHITLAYFEKISTVDYIGTVQGIPICFDAKECSVDTYPLHNIHEHQVEFMEKFEKQEGIAFIILYYSHKNLFYYMTFRELEKFWQRALDKGRKSFKLEELNSDFFMALKNGYFIPILDFIQLDMDNRKNV
jgi:recombination protein U